MVKKLKSIFYTHLEHFSDKEVEPIFHETYYNLIDYKYPKKIYRLTNLPGFDKNDLCSQFPHIEHYFLPALFLLDNFKNKNTRILDIGCYYCIFIDFLHKKGYHHSYGVDILKRAINFGHELGIKNIYNINMFQISDSFSFKFDIVFCIGVINDDANFKCPDGSNIDKIMYRNSYEQIVSMIKLLFIQVNKILKVGGIFYITLPEVLYTYSKSSELEELGFKLIHNPKHRNCTFIYKKMILQ